VVVPRQLLHGQRAAEKEPLIMASDFHLAVDSTHRREGYSLDGMHCVDES